MKPRPTTSPFGTAPRINHDSSPYYNSRLHEGLPVEQAKPLPDNPFPGAFLDTLLERSAEDLHELPERCLHLMVTSPPYNVTKEYDQDLSLPEYLDLLRKVFTETYRLLVDGGRACVNVANLGRRPYLPLSLFVSQIMLDIGFQMRGEIIWNKGAGAGKSMAWGSWRSASNPVLRDVHEYILIFCKGPFKRAKPAGKENTISRDEFMEWTRSVWTFSPESAKKVGHPAPFPVELPHRLIQLYTFSGDLVFDPFMGSGTTALAALQSERRYLGCEIDPAYIALARQRIQNLNR